MGCIAPSHTKLKMLIKKIIYIYIYVCKHVEICATVRVVGVNKHGAQTVIAARVASVGSVALVGSHASSALKQ